MLIPAIWLVAVHLVQKVAVIVAAQHGLHLARQTQPGGAPGGPGRLHAASAGARPHAHVRRPGLLAQPVQQGFARSMACRMPSSVSRRVAAHAVGHASRCRSWLPSRHRAAPRCMQAAQHGSRFWAAVDQVAEQVHRVAAG